MSTSESPAPDPGDPASTPSPTPPPPSAASVVGASEAPVVEPAGATHAPSQNARREGLVLGGLAVATVWLCHTFAEALAIRLAWGVVALAVMLALLLVALTGTLHWFRDDFLRWLGLGDRQEILGPLRDGVTGLAAGNVDRGLTGFVSAGQAIAHRWASASMRVWSAGILVAIVGIMITGAGTLLLLQQNRLLGEQNDKIERELAIAMFEQVNQFREMLRRAPRNEAGQPLVVTDGDASGLYRWPPPDASVVSQIQTLGLSEPALVIPALRPLLIDRNSTIATGALYALHSILSAIHENPGHRPDVAAVVSARLWGEFEWASITSATLFQAQLPKTRLLRQAQLAGSDLTLAYLPGADLTRVNLREACLRRAHLKGATLDSAYIRGANFNGAKLDGARMRDLNMMRYGEFGDDGRAFYFGLPQREGERRDISLVAAEMTGCDLAGSTLTDACLFGAILVNANLNGTTLCRSDLRFVELTGAHFKRANFDNVDLRGAWAGTNPDGSRRLISAEILDGVAAVHSGARFGEIPRMSLQEIHTELGLRHPDDVGDTLWQDRGVVDIERSRVLPSAESLRASQVDPHRR